MANNAGFKIAIAMGYHFNFFEHSDEIWKIFMANYTGKLKNAMEDHYHFFVHLNKSSHFGKSLWRKLKIVMALHCRL